MMARRTGWRLSSRRVHGADAVNSSSFRCYLVDHDAQSNASTSIARRPLDDLPPGDVLIRVGWSSLNYKDALAATGRAGVVRRFPHVPGIDAAGTIAESGSSPLQPGQSVLVTGYELGAGRWGGWAEYIRVPWEWVVPLPEGLSMRESMILGTAGFTAALSVEALLRGGVTPPSGEIVVTGASGGVGSISVMLLAQLGFRVAAVTGKPHLHESLAKWGAARILGRDEVVDTGSRPLLSARWAGAIDTVGGATLATLVRQLQSGGSVAACGLVGGTDLHLTVYPFLLRGVSLLGIDSAFCPAARRIEVWNKLAGPWKPALLDELAIEVPLESIPEHVSRMLAGNSERRVIVRVSDQSG